MKPRGANPAPLEPSDTQPYPHSTQPMPPSGGYPPQQPAYSPYPQDPQTGYAQLGYPPIQGYPPSYPPGYPTGNNQTGYQAAYPYPQNGYPPQAGSPPMATFPPAPPTPVADPGPNRAWKILALSLGVVLLFVCGLAAWTFTSVASGRATVFGAQFSTQVAEVVSVPTATAPAEMPSPTPWPTFTPEPTEVPPETQAPPPDSPGPEATPNTPPINVEKLLSPECSAALDRMNQVNDEFKKDPTLPFKEDWRVQFSQATGDLKTYCGSLDSASPVPGMLNETQQKINQASSEFDQATRLFDEGVKELNPGKFLEAAQHAGAAGKNLSEAIAELKKIGQ